MVIELKSGGKGSHPYLMLPSNFVKFNCIAFDMIAAIAEYTGCISAGKTPSNECPDNETKSNGEASVMLELWGNTEYPFIAIVPRPTQAWSGST